MNADISPQAPTVETPADLSAAFKLRRGRHKAGPSPRRMRRLYTAVLVLSDGLMMGLGFFLAYLVRFTTHSSLFQTGVTPSFPFYTQVVLGLIPLWLLIFATFGLYNPHRLLGGVGEYARAFHASTAGLLAVVFAAFVVEQFVIARGWLLLAWLFTFLLVIAARFWLRRLVYALRRRGYFLSPALLVGGNGEARLLAHQLSAWPTSGLNLLGLVADNLPPGQRVVRNLYALGKLQDLPGLVQRYGVEELILASSALSRETMLDIFRRYGFTPGMNIRFSSGLFEIMTTGVHVRQLAQTSLIGVNQVRLTGLERGLKTGLDLVLTVAGLFCLAPLLLLIGLLIRLDSSGPIFHRRRVVGVGGREFDAFKFRTMYLDGERLLAGRPDLQAELARNHKLKDDPRVTRVGRILRRSSLDELPQLFNVLLGQMSLVGPRMISPPELADYGQWEMNLLTVKPGLTGLWQVSGRSDLAYEDRVRLDMHYIRNHSLWLDLYILWRTLPAVIKGRGAY
ncbi:MAG: sugar transferase, partial [Anaerolineae bacterium]